MIAVTTKPKAGGAGSRHAGGLAKIGSLPRGAVREQFGPRLG